MNLTLAYVTEFNQCYNVFSSQVELIRRNADARVLAWTRAICLDTELPART